MKNKQEFGYLIKLYNLGRVNYQETSFKNLFQFFAGKQFHGMSFFAVTPGFVYECKNVLQKIFSKKLGSSYLNQELTSFNFDTLPTFEMSPLLPEELENLAMKIVKSHGIAYKWEPDSIVKTSDLKAIVKQAATKPVQDRARYTICQIVDFLDCLRDQAE